MYEYKLLNLYIESFESKGGQENIEGWINHYAKEGWELDKFFFYDEHRVQLVFKRKK